MESRFHDAGTSEARNAAFYYERRRSNLGVEFLAAVLLGVDEIEAHPGRFAEVEGSKGNREFRRTSVDRFPYSIIYEVLPDEVVVLAVAHHSRRPGYWRRRRP